jgi:CRISPR-associated protein Cmr1
MFIAGADGMAAEIRPSSFKGVLRYWWRSLNGGLLLENLKKKEAHIFGSSDEKVGRSMVVIRISEYNFIPSKDKLPIHNINVNSNSKVINVLDYLAFGVVQSSDRYYIPVDSNFTVTLLFSDKLNENEISEVIDAFYCIAYIGGIGAKSRNGYGRFSITSIDGIDKYNQLSNFDYLISVIKNKSSIEYAKYTAFSKHTKFYKLQNDFNSWNSCLAAIGKIYRKSRLDIEPKHIYNKRIYIGSPIIQNRTSAMLNRHSKTHFITVIKENDKYYAYIIFIPYRYCVDAKRDDFHIASKSDVNDLFNEYIKATKEFNAKIIENGLKEEKL